MISRAPGIQARCRPSLLFPPVPCISIAFSPATPGTDMPLPQFSLAGSRAVVTGAARGIGQAIALGLAEAGAEVVITGRDLDALAETEHRIEASGGCCGRQRLDVAQP